MNIDIDITDKMLCIILVSTFLIWNLYEGAVFESSYPEEFVKLYGLPLWRFVIVLAVLFATLWSPYVGIMLAFTVFFYIEDLEKLNHPWTNTK